MIELEATEASAPPPPRATAWLPLLAAAGAGAAAVLVALLIVNVIRNRDAPLPAPDMRLARIEQQLRELAARPPPAGVERGALDDLAGRLARLEATLATSRAAPDLALANRLAALEGEVKAMAETVAIIGRRSDEIAVNAREARQRAEAGAATLAELSQKVARLTAPTVERTDFDALSKRVDAVERGEKAVEAELARRPATEDRALRRVVVATSLKSAVERGEPYAAELAAARALAADGNALAPLERFAATGLPAAAALSRELAALTPALLAAAGAPARDGGFLDKLQASAEKLVRVRPLEEREVAGSDPATIVTRVEVKAAHADLAGALAELGKLPPPVRAPAQAWIEQAQARAAAVEASRRFAADALAGLGK
jgi:hypothetical protein